MDVSEILFKIPPDLPTKDIVCIPFFKAALQPLTRLIEDLSSSFPPPVDKNITISPAEPLDSIFL